MGSYTMFDISKLLKTSFIPCKLDSSRYRKRLPWLDSLLFYKFVKLFFVDNIHHLSNSIGGSIQETHFFIVKL